MIRPHLSAGNPKLASDPAVTDAFRSARSCTRTVYTPIDGIATTEHGSAPTAICWRAVESYSEVGTLHLSRLSTLKLELTCTDGQADRSDNGEAIHARLRQQLIPASTSGRLCEENQQPEGWRALPPFTGGLVGYFSYDYMKYAEPALKLTAKDEEGFKDVDLMLFDKVIAFDHFRQKVILIVNHSAARIWKTGYH